MDRSAGQLTAVPGETEREGKSLSVYVGIPFCKTLCTYCDFNVYAHLGKLFEPYTLALTHEIQRVASDAPPPRRARSLAFGGGTPSILPASLLTRIFAAVNEHFELELGAEISLEANPGTVDLEKLRALRSLGVNRLSLGAQSFDDARLKAFNRNHNAAQIGEAFELARRAGFDNINLDLLYGLPDQTLAAWSETLDKVLAFQSEHLSLYGLQVEDGTALARQIAQGRVHQPDDDLAADMYALVEEKLNTAGFEHYEISNWARPGYESRHNLTYWLNRPYLGFGAGAHSYFGGARYENVHLPAEYISRLAQSDSVIAKSEVISRAMEMAETMMLGLRLERGIGSDDFEARFGVDARRIYVEVLAQMQAWGLMEANEERMWLTPHGRLVSNQVLWRFLPDEAPMRISGSFNLTIL